MSLAIRATRDVGRDASVGRDRHETVRQLARRHGSDRDQRHVTRSSRPVPVITAATRPPAPAEALEPSAPVTRQTPAARARSASSPPTTGPTDRPSTPSSEATSVTSTPSARADRGHLEPDESGTDDDEASARAQVTTQRRGIGQRPQVVDAGHGVAGQPARAGSRGEHERVPRDGAIRRLRGRLPVAIGRLDSGGRRELDAAGLPVQRLTQGEARRRLPAGEERPSRAPAARRARRARRRRR